MSRRALLLSVIACACARQPQPVPPTALPLEGLDRGQIVVHATLSGRSLRFLLDSGATVTTIAPGTAAQLALPKQDGGIRVLDATGAIVSAPAVTLDGLTIAGRSYHLTAYVAANAIDPTLDGMLGVDFFGQNDVELDFVSGELRLYPPGGAPARAGESTLAITDARGMMRVDGSLDGRAVAALIDTGSNATVVSPPAAGDIDPEPAAPLTGLLGGTHEMWSYRYDRFTLGGTTWTRPTLHIGIVDAIIAAVGKEPAVLIGLDLFAHHRVVFDLRDHLLRIS